MTCKKCGKEIETINTLCPECEAIVVAAQDVKKAKMYGFTSALLAAISGVFGIVFAVFALSYSSAAGPWFGFAAFAVVLTALGFMFGGSAVVIYVDRFNFEVKPFITLILGTVAMGLSLVSAILFLVSLIIVSWVAFLVALGVVALVIGFLFLRPILAKRRAEKNRLHRG